MEQIKQILQELEGNELSQIIISNKRRADVGKKVVVRPFVQKGEVLYQFARYENNQVFHKNMDKEEMISEIVELLTRDYKQMEVKTSQYQYSALVSKKGKATVKRRKADAPIKIELSHNRKKTYILEAEDPIPFLVELGVQTKDGKIVDKKYKKFRQINRFLEFIKDVLPELPKDRKITIIDFGCGKSYLTFAMYHYLKVMNQYDVCMIGLDLKKDVIAHCNQLAQQFGYEDLTFLQGDISSYEGVDQVDMVVTLHACDTATDFAMDKAVRWGAKVILSVPCCQHEMNQQIQNEFLQPVLKYGIIKERISALLTDALRANLLEQQGYDVQILEFIDMEHTPKNILIRGVKKGKQAGTTEEYNQLCQSLNFHGTLEELLKNADI